MTGLISIIVPIYNASIYLRQCIESILCQTYRELEIILVDDGSTDDSLQICEKYQEIDGRIKVIHRENGGSVAARKSGLKAANGAYVGFVDADDYIEPDMFEKLYAKVKEFHVDFVHSGMITDNTKICNYEEGVTDLTLCDRADYISKNVFKTQTILFALWSKLFQVDLVREAYMKLPDEQSYGEDLLCLCNCLLKCSRFYMLQDAFYHYQIYEGSLSHLNWMDACIEESRLHAQVVKFLKRNNLLERCGNSAKYHYRKRIIQAMTGNQFSGISVLNYRFANIGMLKGKKIALYGAGVVGKDFYRQISQMNQCEITAWVDKQKYGKWNLVSIGKPETLKEISYDILILAVKNKAVADEIKEELIQNDICKNGSAVWWEEPVYIWQE